MYIQPTRLDGLLRYMENTKIFMRVTTVSLIANTLLFAFKITAGLVSGSIAMISDAVHTASDLLTTVIVIFGYRYAHKSPKNGGKKTDCVTNNPNNCETSEAGSNIKICGTAPNISDMAPNASSVPRNPVRAECTAAIILAVCLAATGIWIGWGAANSIITGAYRGEMPMAWLALTAAIVSIIVKECLFHYVNRTAKRINSTALRADAWYSRSDAVSSVGSFAGILGVMLGAPILDPIKGIIICGLIVFAAISIFKDSLKKIKRSA